MTFSQEGRRFRAIAWRAGRARRAPDAQPRRVVNLAFSLEGRTSLKGETYLELTVADIKSLDGVE